MVAARTRLEIATQNLANVSTTGYRRIRAHGFLTALGVTIVRDRERGYAAQARADGRRVAGRLPNGVDAIAEMIDVLAAQRSFESAQKAVTAIDLSREKAAEAARVQ